MKRYLFIIAIFASSCSSNPTSPASGSGSVFGEFGYTVNKQNVLRDVDSIGTAAQASIDYPTCTISLTYPLILHGYHVNVLQIALPLNGHGISPGAWKARGQNDTGGAVITFQYQVGLNYHGPYNIEPSGSVIVTTFDTTDNLISGTFHFILFSPLSNGQNAIDTVVNGFFNNVPILSGGGGFAGALSGIRNDLDGGIYDIYQDDSFKSPQNGISSITCWKDAGTMNLYIQANVYYPDASYTSLNITTYGAQAGYFSFVTGSASGSFSDSDGASGGLYTGGITITKFDSLNRRFSGTFSIGGSGSAGPNTFNSSFQGSMDSVRWFDM
jgi:hypothetical protein